MEKTSILTKGLNKIANLLGCDNKHYSDTELENFNFILDEINNDLTKIKQDKQKTLEKENIEKAIQLLKNNNIEEFFISRFGIYYQYELASEEITCEPFCDDYRYYDKDKLILDKIDKLLYFVDEDYIFKILKYPREGQNELYLTQKGFEYREFYL